MTLDVAIIKAPHVTAVQSIPVNMCGRLAFRESAFCALVLLLAAGQPARGQTIGGDYGPADIAYGARLYTMHRAQCHGATGDQVGTVDLRSGKFKNASTDPQQSSMPAYSGKLTSAEVADLVAYLLTLKGG